MTINRYNDEYYPDPTACGALTSIEKELQEARKYRPIVYICSPYSGDTHANIQNAIKYCKLAVSKGYIPLAPHLLFPQFLNDKVAYERELGLHFARVLMRFCAEVWVFGDYISSGMEDEIKSAKKRHIIIKYISTDSKEVPKCVN